jgi:hypothetical protein
MVPIEIAIPMRSMVAMMGESPLLIVIVLKVWFKYLSIYSWKDFDFYGIFTELLVGGLCSVFHSYTWKAPDRFVNVIEGDNGEECRTIQ